MMKLFAAALLVLGTLSVAHAQETATVAMGGNGNVAPDFAATSGARITLIDPLAESGAFFPPAATPMTAPAAADTATPWNASLESAEPPAPSPEPRFVFGGRDDYRWQLGLGATWFRFRSSIFNASAVGIKTSLGYFTNNWFAIEGNVTAAFAPTIYSNEHVKLLVYGIGPKIALRQRQWEPWLHALVGGAHEQPQTAGNTKNAYSLQLGGGADYRWNPRIAFRLEGDYVRTGFFSQSQNDFQLAGGIVFHF
jgi:hypothetical protein